MSNTHRFCLGDGLFTVAQFTPSPKENAAAVDSTLTRQASFLCTRQLWSLLAATVLRCPRKHVVCLLGTGDHGFHAGVNVPRTPSFEACSYHQTRALRRVLCVHSSHSTLHGVKQWARELMKATQVALRGVSWPIHRAKLDTPKQERALPRLPYLSRLITVVGALPVE